jgi:hypothetical protein
MLTSYKKENNIQIIHHIPLLIDDCSIKEFLSNIVEYKFNYPFITIILNINNEIIEVKSHYKELNPYIISSALELKTNILAINFDKNINKNSSILRS